MRNVRFALYIIAVAVAALYSIAVYCQETVISDYLKSKIEASADTEMIRVLVFFKGKKVFSPEEKSTMNSMALSERQTYHARALKEFGDMQSSGVKAILNAGANSSRCKLVADLWAANGISCWATKDIIQQIANLPEVKEIVWDYDRPTSQLKKDIFF